MAYTIEQFQKDVANEYLHYLTPEEILKQIAQLQEMNALLKNNT